MRECQNAKCVNELLGYWVNVEEFCRPGTE